MGKEAFENASGNPRYERVAERLTHIVGQEDAIKAIRKRLQSALDGSSGPTFIFTGPDGVGKSETAKEIAEGSGTDFIRLEMSDYSRAEDHYRLIGSLPGDGSVGALMAVLDKIRSHPRSVLMIDEIEKAHPKALSIINDILLTRSTTLTDGRDADFENATVIITTRLDRDAMKKLLAEAGLFSRNLPEGQTIDDALEAALPKEAIIFQPISEDALKEHIRQRIANMSERLRRERGSTLGITEDAVNDIAKRLMPKTAEFGLRPVRFLIEDEVGRPLVKMILRSDGPLNATVDVQNGSLTIYNKAVAAPSMDGPAVTPP